ncbi:MAG: hypothetical protein KDA93_01685 [Planctomycetaceae bacterium]|nr:hypothetical protein [Planctomycetaceae bacterium]
MDPNTTWDTLLYAYATKDFKSAVEHADALIGWLDSGGFPPSLTIGSTTLKLTCQLDEDWNRALASAACMHILNRFGKEDEHAAH